MSPHALVVLAVLFLTAGCSEPNPEKVCAAAAQAAPGLDVNLCVSDLNNEKVNDPSTFDRDVECLGGLRAGANLDTCLQSLRSLPQVQAKRRPPPEGAGAAVVKALDGLRNIVDVAKTDQQRAALRALLDQAKGEGDTVNQQLGAKVDAGRR